MNFVKSKTIIIVFLFIVQILQYQFVIMDLVKQEYVEQIQKKISHPQIKCSSGNKVQKFCTNKDCKFQALCCRTQECPNCSKNHEDCFFGQIQQLTKRVQNHLSFQKKTVASFFKIENNLINELTGNRKQMIDQNNFGKSNNKLPKTINSIYFKNEASNLVGADMSQIFSQLSLKYLEQETQKSLQKYQKQAESLLKNILNLRQSLLDAIFRKKRQVRNSQSKNDLQQKCVKQIEGNNEIVQVENQSQTRIKFIDSKILQYDNKGRQQLDYLLKELGNPSQLELLFRASQNDFLASQFHLRCNNFKNTVTIIRTEFGKTIAGYTPVQWRSKGSHSPDPSAQSFLLQLDLREKMSLKKTAKAIYDNHKWGPSFGLGDILITDKCNENTQSYSNFPYAYSMEIKDKNHQQICSAFVGVPNGKNFRIVEYEVLKVIM